MNILIGKKSHTRVSPSKNAHKYHPLSTIQEIKEKANLFFIL